MLKPKAEAIALLVQNLHAVTGLVEKDEKHGIEHRYFYVELDQRSEAVNGLSEIHGFGVEIDFFDFSIGSHHDQLAPGGIGSTASCIS